MLFTNGSPTLQAVGLEQFEDVRKTRLNALGQARDELLDGASPVGGDVEGNFPGRHVRKITIMLLLRKRGIAAPGDASGATLPPFCERPQNFEPGG